MIILTSNVGSSIAGGSTLGFERSTTVFRPEQVERALAGQFRPEFLNRLDRVVVFRPFERAQMRALLDKELADVTRAAAGVAAPGRSSSTNRRSHS